MTSTAQSNQKLEKLRLELFVIGPSPCLFSSNAVHDERKKSFFVVIELFFVRFMTFDFSWSRETLSQNGSRVFKAAAAVRTLELRQVDSFEL